VHDGQEKLAKGILRRVAKAGMFPTPSVVEDALDEIGHGRHKDFSGGLSLVLDAEEVEGRDFDFTVAAALRSQESATAVLKALKLHGFLRANMVEPVGQ